MPIIELSTALVAAGSGLVVPFMNKVLEKSAQRLGGHVDEHLAALFTRAHDYLAATCREPQSVEAKIAVPLLQAATLESDPTLIEKWAALLANAADPMQWAQVQPGFVEVLRQLTSTDASVLEIAAGITPTNHVGGLPGFVQVTSLHNRLQDIPATALAISIGNLTRLGACLGAASQRVLNDANSFLTPAPRLNTVGPGLDFIKLTPFGLAFLAAVTPPTK